MELQATAEILGNFGEFVAAIAVVVTLGYLAVQIRQSNIASQTSAIQGFFDSWEWIGEVDQAQIQTMRKGYNLEWQDISKDEQVQLHMYWAN